MKYTIFKGPVLTLLFFLISLSSQAQRSSVTIYSTNAESGNCFSNISAYRTFIKEELYEDAYPTWLKVFNACPDSSELIYLDGVTIFRSFIESTPPGPLREARIDTLMLIYDRRMEYFGGEGNVLGRKAGDMLAYRGKDIAQVQQANQMLRSSIELEGPESREIVMRLSISSGMLLHERGLLTAEQLVADYVLMIGHLKELEKENSRWGRTRSIMEEMLLSQDILSCEALENHFDPLMDQQQDDPGFQETVISAFRPLECDRSPVLTEASENLYRLQPGAESAHSLSRLFIASNDLGKAEFYLNEALRGDGIDEKTRAQWYYELALVKNALEDYCEAITHARKAITLNPNYGQAYMLLGDAIIASRKSLGDDFQRRTAYWAAADMYEKAATVNSSLEGEATRKLSKSKAQFPDREDIFFSDIREGESYRVEGCINETTTVRARE